MKVVRKKIIPQYFKDVCSGKKNFELRKDEDDIQVGDILVLEEWDLEMGRTGYCTERKVTYILRNVPEYGLKDGYCIIGW